MTSTAARQAEISSADLLAKIQELETVVAAREDLLPGAAEALKRAATEVELASLGDDPEREQLAQEQLKLARLEHRTSIDELEESRIAVAGVRARLRELQEAELTEQRAAAWAEMQILVRQREALCDQLEDQFAAVSRTWDEFTATERQMRDVLRRAGRHTDASAPHLSGNRARTGILILANRAISRELANDLGIRRDSGLRRYDPGASFRNLFSHWANEPQAGTPPENTSAEAA